MIIGVTGFFAAGKDTFAEYLEEKGFVHFSLSDMIRDELRLRGMEINIPNLTAVGNELRRAGGSGVLADRALKKIDYEKNTIVTSIRHPDELASLRAGAGNFTMFFVNAPMVQRFERCKDRGRSGDALTLESFEAAEKQQLESDDPAAQQLLACRELADIEISNDADLVSFQNKIDEQIALLDG